MSARTRLPNRRLAESFSFECAGLRYTATVGRYSDGSVGELFLNNHRATARPTRIRGIFSDRLQPRASVRRAA